MKVAIFGCLHGMLNEMYSAVENYETKHSIKVDFILVCGDCQTIRHYDDLKCLAVPNKYKKIGDFHEYYSGKKKIPKLTIFVGGNHEASNYLMTLPYGGWVCDNFYYLGYAGVIRYKGFRIAGVSGIYNYHNCNKGRYERMPLNEESIRSIYHTRRLDIFRLQLLSRNAIENESIDIFLSHDWPTRIYDHGNREQLLRFKPAFRSDVESSRGLGSPLTQPLVSQLKPKRWFAAHLHCRFYAKVPHDSSGGRCTEFLSLNKIENGRNFMEVLDLTPSRQHDSTDNDIYYDEEWLTILKKTVNLELDSRNNVHCPRIEDNSGEAYIVSAQEIQETVDLMNKTGGLKIERNFKMTEPVIYNRPNAVQPSLDQDRKRYYPNPQNEELCSRLKLREVKESGQPGSYEEFKPNVNVKTEDVRVKHEPEVKIEPVIKVEPRVKMEVTRTETDPPTKKLALGRSSDPIELDEDGCLPFYIETKGDKSRE